MPSVYPVCDIKGDLSSPPVLVRDSACRHEFDWETAAACQIDEVQGDNCAVTDNIRGWCVTEIMCPHTGINVYVSWYVMS